MFLFLENTINAWQLFTSSYFRSASSAAALDSLTILSRVEMRSSSRFCLFSKALRPLKEKLNLPPYDKILTLTHSIQLKRHFKMSFLHIVCIKTSILWCWYIILRKLNCQQPLTLVCNLSQFSQLFCGCFQTRLGVLKIILELSKLFWKWRQFIFCLEKYKNKVLNGYIHLKLMIACTPQTALAPK